MHSPSPWLLAGARAERPLPSAPRASATSGGSERSCTAAVGSVVFSFWVGRDAIVCTSQLLFWTHRCSTACVFERRRSCPRPRGVGSRAGLWFTPCLQVEDEQLAVRRPCHEQRVLHVQRVQAVRQGVGERGLSLAQVPVAEAQEGNGRFFGLVRWLVCGAALRRCGLQARAPFRSRFGHLSLSVSPNLRGPTAQSTYAMRTAASCPSHPSPAC